MAFETDQSSLNDESHLRAIHREPSTDLSLRMPNPPASPALQAMRNSDSWVEVSSRQSSSSLSSANAEYDGIHTLSGHNSRQGRTVRGRQQQHHNRNAATPLRLALSDHQQSSGEASSSQDEYEESESESDRVMTSSNEVISHASSSSPGQPSSTLSDDLSGAANEDSDENATALGVASSRRYRTTAAAPTDDSCFTPQPNAFSHPPSVTFRQHSHSSEGSYFPPMATRTSSAGSAPQPSTFSRPTHSQPTSRRNTNTAEAAMAHMQQADHDAALRASLTTILSCAAAARGHNNKWDDASSPPKNVRPVNTMVHSTQIQPSTLRMVPESALPSRSSGRHATNNTKTRASEPNPATQQSSGPTIRDAIAKSRIKHKSSTTVSSPLSDAVPMSPSRSTRRNASPSPNRRRASKRAKHAHNNVGTVSPTLLTWVVSAGVLVLVGALSFSAGYGAAKRGERVDAWSGSPRVSASATGAGDKRARGSGFGLRRRLWEGVVGSGMTIAGEGSSSVSVGA